MFALANNNGDISIFDVRKSDPLRVLKGHKLHVWTIDFSPDGRTLVSGGYDGQIKIWSLSVVGDIGTIGVVN